ncbi:hypothetical protein PV04_08034 [Phialophora macrospora]|uniref:Zn(2)-C6 fungal-type domain-containing protein n=1 Tax=Phialophora macrospora TaxID=1851006 RepID=A0A0D2CKG7_9EURO|nr:hypothetical protein PV04_08034 [Phialophora macrospora]
MGIRRGCFNCNKRRITCDESEPQCLKCVRKGLECSGNGIRYRFNNGVASRGRLKGLSIPVPPDSPQNASCTNDGPSNKDVAATGPTRQIEPGLTSQYPPRQSRSSPGSRGQDQEDQHKESQPVRIYRSVEPLNSQARLLFSHFSLSLAPGMVILDGQHNGYRSYILPLAVCDPLVQQAVLSVAGLDLWRNNPDQTRVAELSRARVIRQLKEESMAGEASDVFSASTWVTLLVLLMGELFLGGDHYIYFLGMMHLLRTRATGIYHPDAQIIQFLQRQTDLITLLAQPFLDPSSCAIQASDTVLDTLLRDSMESCSSPADRRTVAAVVEAGRLCLHIHGSRALGCRASHAATLRRVRDLISHVHPCTAGGNSLVWVYFIAAADSDTDELRAFFTARLQDIYNATGWANIAAGLAVMDKLWDRRSDEEETSWARLLPQVCSAFVI